MYSSIDFLQNHLFFCVINNIINYVPWILIIFFINLIYPIFNFCLYNDRFDKVEKLKKSIIYSNLKDFRNNPIGYMIGIHNINNKYYLFFGYSYIYSSMHGREILKTYMFMNKELKNILMPKSENNSTLKKKGDINGYYSTYVNLWNIHTTRIEKFPEIFDNNNNKIDIIKQDEIVSDIIKNFHIHTNISTVICGKPGSGKTSISSILSIKLSEQGYNINVLLNFNPFIENNHIEFYINDFNPDYSKKNILILNINEIDEYLNNMNNLKNDANLRPLIKDKSSWNDFFDSFSSKFYGDGIIIIMTSNKSKNYITGNGFFWDQSLDNSYFRNNRINLKYELN